MQDSQVVQTMIDLAIAKYHGENVARLTSIEARLIGIDGNGTGREGAIQRLEKKMDENTLVTNRLGDSVDRLSTSSRFWSKKSILSVGWAAFSIVIALATIVAGEWIKHKMGW